MTLRHRKKGKYKNLKNKVFRLRIPDSEYAPNMDYLDYYRLQKYQGSVEIASKYFSTMSFVAYEKSDGNIFVILEEEEDHQTLFCDYLHKNELNIFMDSIKDRNEDYHNNYNEIYCEDIGHCIGHTDVEDIDVCFELVEMTDKYEIPINFDNGIWYPTLATDEDDVMCYDYRDELVDTINKEFGFYVKNPDIKKGIQKTIFDC